MSSGPRHDDEAVRPPSSNDVAAQTATDDQSRTSQTTETARNSNSCDDHQSNVSAGITESIQTEQPPTRLRSWQTLTSIAGFYVIALLTAIAHLCVFIHLHGRVIAGSNEEIPFESTSIPQSYVTTISLLLVTIFRASLVACISVCYVQCLWATMRRQTMEVQLIEELFQIRSNALRLFNPKLLRYAPSLFLLATISWLIPLATLYPPGAMTVSLETRSVHNDFNVSVIPWGEELKNYTILDMPGAEQDPSNPGPLKKSFLQVHRSCSSYTSSLGCWTYTGPIQPLIELAKFTMVRAKIPDLPNPSVGNASYTMSFPGPVMQCNDKNGTNVTTTVPEDYSEQPSTYAMTDEFTRRYDTLRMWHETDGIIVEEAPNPHEGINILLTPCPRLNPESDPDFPMYDLDKNTTFFRPVTRRRCTTAAAKYIVNVSFLNGVQKVEYTTEDIRPLVPVGAGSTLRPLNFDIKPLQYWQEWYNILALVHSMTMNFVGAGFSLLRDEFVIDGQIPKPIMYRLDDGTEVEACPATWGRRPVKYLGPWQSNYVFDLSPFTGPVKSDQGDIPVYITPLDEGLLNEMLANITIGALSLNLWHGTANGSVFRTYTVYRFDRRLNFYLPYGLCLLLSLPIVAFGIWALRSNGVSAIDGGFVQILMTAATGNTAVEQAARGGCFGGSENIPEELKRLQVRFGELISAGIADAGEVGTSKTERETAIERPCSPDLDGTIGEAATVSLLEDQDDVESQEVRSSHSTTTSGVAPYNTKSVVTRRAGFGTLEETVPLRRARDVGGGGRNS